MAPWRWAETLFGKFVALLANFRSPLRLNTSWFIVEHPSCIVGYLFESKQQYSQVVLLFASIFTTHSSNVTVQVCSSSVNTDQGAETKHCDCNDILALPTNHQNLAWRPRCQQERDQVTNVGIKDKEPSKEMWMSDPSLGLHAGGDMNTHKIPQLLDASCASFTCAFACFTLSPSAIAPRTDEPVHKQRPTCREVQPLTYSS